MHFPTQFRTRLLSVFLSFTAVFLAIVVTADVMKAATITADLNNSSKSVNLAEALPGQMVRYTIAIHNSGVNPALTAALTDTLPIELSYEVGSLAFEEISAFTLDYGVSGQVITWTGSLGVDGMVNITFNAWITDTVMEGDVITNTAVLTGTGGLITLTTTTNIISTYYNYLPLILRPAPPVVIQSISRPNQDNLWTVTWQDAGPEVTAYQIQEAQSLDFSQSPIIDAGLTLSRQFQHAPSINPHYCYRVRALVGTVTGAWSQPACGKGIYFDNMENSASGWSIRREDTDDIDNSSWYAADYFALRIGGRWDYAIASPLAAGPTAPYRIEAYMYLREPKNLNSYGLIFGGDWNGQPCPNDDFSSCFNQYYRLNVIATGSSNSMVMNLKRIDFHRDEDNTGDGVDLISFMEVTTNDPAVPNLWRIDVSASGVIRVYVNNVFLAQATDTEYINRPYFGLFASSNEYCCAQPHLQWYRVTPLQP
jgi:uncharacterized repeat protein (TIGR01451 family)